MDIALKSRFAHPSGTQIFTFSTPTGDVERTLSAKRSDKGGALMFVFVLRKGKWVLNSNRADTVRNRQSAVEGLTRHDPSRSTWAIVSVDATRPA